MPSAPHAGSYSLLQACSGRQPSSGGGGATASGGGAGGGGVTLGGDGDALPLVAVQTQGTDSEHEFLFVSHGDDDELSAACGELSVALGDRAEWRVLRGACGVTCGIACCISIMNGQSQQRVQARACAMRGGASSRVRVV